jgi:hypothetical protein
MIALTTTEATIAGVILAIWLAAAAWAVITGMQMRKRAEFATDQADRLAALLESAPALALIVRGDGRVEAQPRLADWLGLPRVPNFVADFAGKNAGLSEDDAATLVAEVAAAQRTGKAFALAMRAIGSNRTLLLRGSPAATGLAARGSVIVWVFDATESQAEIGRLGDEVAQLGRAFSALSQHHRRRSHPRLQHKRG